MTYLPRNHFLNQKYGPFSEDRDELGKLTLPDEPPPREPVGEPATRLEPPARVRYPAKRITTAEMKKRVRNMLEYVGRVRQEETKRKERAEMIGIDVGMLPRLEQTDQGGDEMLESEEEKRPTITVDNGPTSTVLMDELTRDLIAFQEAFAAGTFTSDVVVPSLAPSSQPPTPALASATTMDGAQGDGMDGDKVEVDEQVEETQGGKGDANVEEATVGGATAEEAPEAVDVYRKGHVSEVVTRPEEVEAA